MEDMTLEKKAVINAITKAVETLVEYSEAPEYYTITVGVKKKDIVENTGVFVDQDGNIIDKDATGLFNQHMLLLQ